MKPSTSSTEGELGAVRSRFGEELKREFRIVLSEVGESFLGRATRSPAVVGVAASSFDEELGETVAENVGSGFWAREAVAGMDLDDDPNV